MLRGKMRKAALPSLAGKPVLWQYLYARSEQSHRLVESLLSFGFGRGGGEAPTYWQLLQLAFHFETISCHRLALSSLFCALLYTYQVDKSTLRLASARTRGVDQKIEINRSV